MNYQVKNLCKSAAGRHPLERADSRKGPPPAETRPADLFELGPEWP